MYIIINYTLAGYLHASYIAYTYIQHQCNSIYYLRNSVHKQWFPTLIDETIFNHLENIAVS